MGTPEAIVRPPGDSFAFAICEQPPAASIDVALAREQHTAYCQTLRDAGLSLIHLPPDEEHPDACFVQDTAVVYGRVALINRFAVASREGEQEAIREVLRARQAFRITELHPPATLDGGDVMIIGTRVLVGLSARTNRAGLAQLRDLLELEGATVESVQVPVGLHLLSKCSYLGRGVLLTTGRMASLSVFAGLDVIRVPSGEAPAANALAVGGTVIVSAGFPHTEAEIQQRGFRVLGVDTSEFAKANGGVTCLSLVLG